MGYGPSLSSKIDDFLHEELGYDTRSEHMIDTPERWMKALKEYKNAGRFNLEFELTAFPSDYDGMVVVGGVQFSSLCPHHLFPYIGTAAVGYMPSDKILGISKLARLIEWATHRLTTQEDATAEIANVLVVEVSRSCAVVLEAVHTCMCARGIRAVGSSTMTAVMRGKFLDNEHGARDEFYRLAGLQRK